ncbi:T9SS type A sorting domain-containing protein [Flavobacterium sp. GA093]|uniref:T9SS type A sorting domain-containing protein n=1 Tax=Flavobacterium hydrocarbonoxydans TaxID=2683249 RepID=A0A6I4NW41_9FLAO|nr:T9SS type A sorting domain-containing protein [Flavobacterium hydrocarbonoxydans]MWB95869.1 T9SS type A sorting domain-containing protein [Flavobacterium hydrocarbonoxydans]
MRTKLLLLLLVANFSIYAQNTAIPDVNFENKLIALGLDSGATDGQVLTANIAGVKTLDVSNSSILDLSGIQDFVALQSLICYNNKLSTLDVTKNIALTSLSCNRNVLTSLDVSQNTLLNNLDCSNNLLNTLDISKNTKLMILSCVDNKLASLDVSNNNLLINIGCDRNALTSLDVTANTKLTTLGCQVNKLTDLDLSKNANLKSLDCNFNLLTSLNVSSNTLLTELRCYSNKITSLDLSANTVLTKLICPANSLTTLDVSKNISLNYLDCAVNMLTTLDVSLNKNLDQLDCASNKLTSLDVSANTALSILNFSSNQITTINLSNHLNLATLNSSYNPLSALDLSKNSSLAKLTCDSNQLTSLNVSKNLKLNYLSCVSNAITSLDFSNNSLLSTLYCSSNALLSLNLKNGKNKLMTSGSLFLKTNPTLSCIQVDDAAYSDLNWASSKDAGATFNSDCNLYTFIPDPKFEQKLIDLGIDTDGKNGLVLSGNIATVTTLDVANSAITDLKGIEGFVALTELNCSGNTLTKLNLSKNAALNSLNASNNASLTCIQVADVDAAANWTTIKDPIAGFSLDCEIYTLIPDSKFEEKLIALGLDADGINGKVITSNIASITSLDVSGSLITSLTGIEDFVALSTLNASNNPITSLDLSKNTALTNLYCNGYNGSPTNGGNGKLTSLDLSKNNNLKVLNCSYNQLNTLIISATAELVSLNCNINKLTKLNFNGSKLQAIDLTGNQIKTLDVSKCAVLQTLNCSFNYLETIDVSKNSNLTIFNCSNNKLLNLNLKNGNNNNLITYYNNSDFKNNPNLTCIQVDDVAYANSDWTSLKDVTANFSGTCTFIETYTLIPDANFEDKLIALNIDKDGKNGKVVTNSINTITSLNIANSSIKDLTGIQDFTELTSLVCNNNEFTTIDLTKNLFLTSLNCSNNQLGTLVLDNNLALSELNASFNQIAKVDLSKNTNLTILNIGFNKLSNLDVSKNTILKELECSNNNIYNLNIKNGNNANMQRMIFGNFTNNPNLSCIQVDNAVYATDNWNATDATSSYAEICAENIAYTLIPDSNFEDKLIALNIDKDGKNGKVRTESIASITNLNVNNSVIADLTGIQDFTALTVLYCYGNQLTSLDVSKNLALTRLECDSNKLTSLDLSKNLNLSHLECQSNTITSLDLSQHKALTRVFCHSNNLTSLNLKNGTNTLLTNTNVFFSNNPNLKCIRVDDVAYADANWFDKKDSGASYNVDCSAYTLIPDSNFEDKLIALEIDKDGKNGKVKTESIASVTELNVSDSAIADLTGIQDFVSLTFLNCSKNALTAIDLSQNTQLESLSIVANKLTQLNLDNNIALTNLNCGNNMLTSLNVSKNTLLTSLACHYNQITSLNVSKNILLEVLMCHYNEITSLDVSQNPELYMLDCLFNKITGLDISNNPKITELACENNNLTYLNLKNGNNVNLDLTYSNFVNNPNLKCIEVDDIAYADANWSAIKDVTATYNVDCAQYTTIPDVNFENKLIALGIDKDGPNGKVKTSSIASVTTLDVSSSAIKDLTGIEDFTALTILNCNTNELTSLTPSKNPLLAELNCSYNAITVIDVTKNPALIAINISNNSLTSLNLKNGFNTNLGWFSVNFTKNPSLSCIQVDDVTYSNDNWNGKLDKTSFFAEDCSNFTLIPDPNFEQKLIDLGIDKDGKNGKVLTTSIAVVTDLNVQLSEINDLTGIEGFASLQYLNCQFNNLTTLDLSGNLNLIELYCHGNLMTSLNVSANTELTTLQTNKNQLTDLDVSKNTKLVYINASENALKILNLKNGNNINFEGALVFKNPALTCIMVDNPTFAASSDVFFKDDTASYSANCTLGLEESVFDLVAVYPNPTKGVVHVDNIALEKATVYNTLGQLVKTVTLDSGDTSNTIDLSGLSKGVYYIYLISGDAASAKKIIVE